MIILSDIAENLASKGVLVHVDFLLWDGLIDVSGIMGQQTFIKVLDRAIARRLAVARTAILEHLFEHSIETPSGNFMLNSNVETWLKTHNKKVEFFNEHVKCLSRYSEAMAKALSTKSVVVYKEYWAKHNDVAPPPSKIMAIMQQTASLVPDFIEIRNKYKVIEYYNNHPFLYMKNNNQDSRDVAWEVINHLVVVHFGRVLGMIKKSLKRNVDKLGAKEFKLAMDAVDLFFKTNLLEIKDFHVMKEKIYKTVDGKCFATVDGKVFTGLLREFCDMMHKFGNSVQKVSDVVNFLEKTT